MDRQTGKEQTENGRNCTVLKIGVAPAKKHKDKSST